MPTRSPTISESARLVSSAIRVAAASVSFITCGRGRGFALAGVVDDGVISVIYSILAGHQSRLEIFRHSGMRPLGRRPGIQHRAPLWIPGSLALRAPRNGGFLRLRIFLVESVHAQRP